MRLPLLLLGRIRRKNRPMRLASHTVLITGGASGIGWALAERFLRAGSEVAVCGRRSSM